MREIKFRAWVKNEYEGDSLVEYMEKDASCFVNPFEDHEDGEIILMQHTGLKDKKGVEIYEGDLLEVEFIFSNRNKLGPFPVTFEHYQWLADEFSFGELVDLAKEGKMSFEVIGNIYENPELMS